MKKRLFLTLLFTSGALFLTGCSNNAGNGALIGSLVGAGIGKSTSNHKDRRALVGAVVGGMVGGAIGTERDRVQGNRKTVYRTAPVPEVNQPVSSNKMVRHTHHYSSTSETHSHTGGNVKHSHTRQYVEPEYGYVAPTSNISTSLYIGGGSYRHHRPRHWRHHHRPRWY